MSEIAGRMSVVMGALFSRQANGGSGVLLGGVPGVLPGRVVVVGGGTSGVNALADGQRSRRGCHNSRISMSSGCGFSTSRWITCTRVYSSEANLNELMPDCDLLIGAVLLPGAKAPEADHARNVAKDEAGQRGGRHRDRPGRLRGNIAPHDASRSSLCRGRRHPLLCGQYAGGVCPHRDAGADERYLSLRRVAGRSRPGRRVQEATHLDRWDQYARWPADLPAVAEAHGWSRSHRLSAHRESFVFQKQSSARSKKLQGFLRLID